MKRMIPFLLAFALLLGCCPAISLQAHAVTEDYYEYSVDNDAATIARVDTSISGDITIPDTLGGYPVTAIADGAFSRCTKITGITIGNNITAIGSNAFRNCTALTAATIGENVSTIGISPFINCLKLTGISVAESNPNFSSDATGILFNKDKTVLIQAPGGMAGSYTIPDSVAAIGDYAFSGSNRLTAITIGNSVTTIGECAFANCGDLTYATLGANVTTIGPHVFYYCRSLTGIQVDESNPNFSNDATGVLYNKEKTELIVAASDSITGSYTIPDSVTVIRDSAFDNCRDMTRLTISASVTAIPARVFWCCENLQAVAIPESVSTIGEGAFLDCSGLTDVYYAGTEAQWAQITIAENNEPLTNATLHFESQMPAEPEQTDESLYEYTVENDQATIIGVTSIPSGEIIIPDTLGGYPVTGIADFVFDHCDAITSVTIPDSVQTIGWSAFGSCTGLTTLTLGSGLTTIAGGAFSGCESLQSVTIPASVFSIVTDAFFGCSSLTGIWVEEGNATYSSDEQGVLFDKEKTILKQAPGALADGYSIPETVTKIATHAFYSCTNLTAIVLPQGVTALEEGAFWACENLTEVTIPASVTTIGDWAFCATALTDVYYGGTEAQWQQIHIGDIMNDELTSATIHYTEVPEQPEIPEVPGDLDGVPGISEDDAIYLLQAILMPDMFPITQDVDFDGNGTINEDDAIYLLQHVLMPDMFPIR